ARTAATHQSRCGTSAPSGSGAHRCPAGAPPAGPPRAATPPLPLSVPTAPATTRPGERGPPPPPPGPSRSPLQRAGPSVALSTERTGGPGRWPRRTCPARTRSEEHTSELQSRFDLVCRLLLEKKNRCRRPVTDLRPLALRPLRHQRAPLVPYTTLFRSHQPPRDPVSAGHLRRRPARVDHRCNELVLQSPCRPSEPGDLVGGLGERAPRA